MHVAGVNIHAIGLAAQNGVTEHGWRVRTLSKLIYEMGHQNVRLQFLKFTVVLYVYVSVCVCVVITIDFTLRN